jgi:mono/diheme cytochrome c family protein
MRSRHLYGLALFAAALLGWRALPQNDASAGQVPAKSGPFEQVVAPFVAKHCATCHSTEKKKGNLALTTYKDAQDLLKNRKVWTSVLQMVGSGEMPPVGRPQPTVEEIEGLQHAVYGMFDVADAGKRDPGKVTMRRLNRLEYKNTVRDLVGIDFDPTEDFPGDDVGYGFDNIGDVLTISPFLMERYLAAAEAISKRAIVIGDPPKAGERPTIAIFLKPELTLEEKRKNARFRSTFAKKDQLYAEHDLTQSGEYIAKARVYGQQAGDDPVKFAILVNDKVRKTFEVKEDKEAATASYELKLTLKKGHVKIAAQLLNEFTDPKDEKKKRGLFVNKLQLVGPLDNRPPSHVKIMAHKEGASKDEAAREILGRFATQAYRRPATPEEVGRLVKLVQKTEAAGDRWDQGIQLALQAVLCSPRFLFRVELDDRADSPAPHAINDYQLASRLAYFLWNTMPDAELFALAAKNELHQNVEAQVRRMLKDEKASTLTDSFLTQWLQLRLLKNVNPDRKLFPDFDDRLRDAMQKESQACFEHILREDRSILELLDANYTFLNDRLARHYGIRDTLGTPAGKPLAPNGRYIPRDQFVKVNFQNDERGGILTQASILTITSNPTRTSPVKRGKWVLEQILGTPPPPPPANVPELDEQGQLTGTLRQRMEQHRKNPSCANCHARMDAMGFAFENFDAIGRFRTKDGDIDIDPSGTLPSGQSFKGASELKRILLGKKDLFARTVAEKLLTYAVGRGLEYYDRRAVDQIVAAVSRDNYRFSTLVVEITKSDPFRMRRGKDQTQ